jgi:hypothetical protein
MQIEFQKVGEASIIGDKKPLTLIANGKVVSL